MESISRYNELLPVDYLGVEVLHGGDKRPYCQKSYTATSPKAFIKYKDFFHATQGSIPYLLLQCSIHATTQLEEGLNKTRFNQDEFDVISKLNVACLRRVFSYHFLKYFSCKKTLLASDFFHSGLLVTTLMERFCQSSKV